MKNLILGYLIGVVTTIFGLSVLAYMRLKNRGELNPRVKGAKVKENVVTKLGGD